MTTSTGNGRMTKVFTETYEPAAGGVFTYGRVHRKPTFIPELHVPMMMTDPRVKFGLRMIKGPILANARFFVADPRSSDTRQSNLKKFLIKQITRFWRSSAVKALSAVEWGWSGSEALYERRRNGILEFDSLRNIYQPDSRVLVAGGKLTGMTVRHVKGRQGKVMLGGPKAFWHVVSREINPWYGESRLFGAYEPWTEFYTDGGAKDIRRLYYHKFAYTGEVGYFPEGTTATPDGAYQKANRDLMLEILEKRKTGAVAAFPNTTDDTGNPNWRIDPATNTVGGAAADMSQYHADLKDEIWEGMGIPTEVAIAEGTGAFAGRRIPQIAFFSMLQELVNWLIFDFNEQILSPLVRLNFGVDPDYEIVPFGLLQGSEEEEEREKQQTLQSADATGQADFGNSSERNNSRRASQAFSLVPEWAYATAAEPGVIAL